MNIDRTVPWSCRAVRAWRAMVTVPAQPAAEDQPFRDGFGARHIAGCIECQRYFARLATLDSSLRSTAAAHPTVAHDDLHRRIMRAVADARPEAPARRRVPAPAFVGLGAAVALAAITAMIQSRDSLLPRRALQPPAVVAPPDSSTVRSAIATAVAPNDRHSSPFGSASVVGPMEPLDQFAPVASALAQDPLQSEVDSVYADARYAVQFLAQNFLPTGALADNRSQPAPDSDLRRGGG